MQQLPADPDARCPRCQRVALAFASADAGFAYGEAMADAVIRMKQRRRDVVPGLARLLAPVLFRVLARQPAVDLIVPVPLHPHRLKYREFNQSLELARAALRLVERETERLAQTAGARPLPAWPLPPLVRNGLCRNRNTRSLGHLGPGERLKEVSGAFAVRTPATFKGKRVLVVDDVMTTGATFHACAETLLAAGAVEVRVLALARAVV
jgi:predicted amidophosphoribosyltransferase